MPNNSDSANPYVGAVSGAASIYGNLNSMYQNGVNSINPQASPITFDAYGDPSYNQGNLIQQAGVSAKGAQAGDYLSNVGAGAAAGAAFGPIGAVVGGVIGGVATAITGSSKKREMEKRRRLALANLAAANKIYGNAKTQFYNGRLAMGDYNNKINSYDRLNNLYMAQSGQQQ